MDEETIRTQQIINMKSKLGDLTIEQFVMLMAELFPKVSILDIERFEKMRARQQRLADITAASTL